MQNIIYANGNRKQEITKVIQLNIKQIKELRKTSVPLFLNYYFMLESYDSRIILAIPILLNSLTAFWMIRLPLFNSKDQNLFRYIKCLPLEDGFILYFTIICKYSLTNCSLSFLLIGDASNGILNTYVCACI